MNRIDLIIFENVAEKMVTWSDKRIGRFIKEYYRCVSEADATPNTGDEAIDMAISCLLSGKIKRNRGGQPGNANARKAKRIENECETNVPINNIIEEKRREENDNIGAPIRSGLPFREWMFADEKRNLLWRDIVDNQGDYPLKTLKEFAEYYGMESNRTRGKLVCEECVGWDTKVMLKRWVNNQKRN